MTRVLFRGSRVASVVMPEVPHFDDGVLFADGTTHYVVGVYWQVGEEGSVATVVLNTRRLSDQARMASWR